MQQQPAGEDMVCTPAAMHPPRIPRSWQLEARPCATCLPT